MVGDVGEIEFEVQAQRGGRQRDLVPVEELLAGDGHGGGSGKCEQDSLLIPPFTTVTTHQQPKASLHVSLIRGTCAEGRVS